jgi:hypothetical protein
MGGSRLTASPNVFTAFSNVSPHDDRSTAGVYAIKTSSSLKTMTGRFTFAAIWICGRLRAIARSHSENVVQCRGAFKACQGVGK